MLQTSAIKQAHLRRNSRAALLLVLQTVLCCRPLLQHAPSRAPARPRFQCANFLRSSCRSNNLRAGPILMCSSNSWTLAQVLLWHQALAQVLLWHQAWLSFLLSAKFGVKHKAN